MSFRYRNGSERLSSERSELTCSWIVRTSVFAALLVLGAAGIGFALPTRFSFTTTPGSSSCGGGGLAIGAAAPFSGAIYNATGGGTKINDLGESCLYMGGGGNTTTPPNPNGAGAITYLDVVSVNGTDLTLGPSAGEGATPSKNCTLGPLSTKHCVNTGVDCSANGDTTCGALPAAAGKCQFDPRCNFGPPIPVNGTTKGCIVQWIANGAGGTLNYVTGSSAVTVPLISYTYATSGSFSANGNYPCPQCLSNVCKGGKRNGQSCTPLASGTTNYDCPPNDSEFLGPLSVTLSPLSTGAVSMVTNGVPVSGVNTEFCNGAGQPGARSAGAFGKANARRIEENGASPGNISDNLPHAGKFAAVFCIPATASSLINAAADLPGPGAVSIAATFRLDGSPDRCGNAVLDDAEQCDDGTLNDQPGSCCRADCTLKSVGDLCRPAAGACDTPEICDALNACPADVLLPEGTTCRASAGDCDIAESCTGLNAACPTDQMVQGGTTCRPAAGECDAPEACSGTAPACPPDGFFSPFVICRASGYECDGAETCTGYDATCPADEPAPSGAPCGADDKPCTADVCNGAGLCTHPSGNPGLICRPATGDCDLAETCSGMSSDCPDDLLAGEGSVCGEDGNPCTADLCDSSGTCMHPAGNAGATCRGPVGPCDVGEVCTGQTGACPADVAAPAGTACTEDGNVCTRDLCDGAGGCDHLAGNVGTTCRPATGPCDSPEACDGDSACPANLFEAPSTECRPVNGPCDIAEHCDGGTAECPTDAVSPTTVTCRTAADICDVTEYCDGANAACPADGMASPAITCRPAGGPCDVTETCDGVHPACPGDAVASTTAICRAPVGVCDVAEHCDGTGKDCPADGFAPPVTGCRPSRGLCDVAEHCDGASAHCPPDGVEPEATLCRPAVGACDVAETCTGASPLCPNDIFQPAATPCRGAANLCDVAETCSGTSATCPADQFVPDGTSCDDQDACTRDDTCQGGICHNSPVACAACSVCNPTEGCVARPRTDCREPMVPIAAYLAIKNTTPDVQDSFDWHWTADGAATDQGDPRVDADYSMCLFGPGEGPLLFKATAPAGGLCGGRPCWRPLGSKGWAYTDVDGTPDGLKSLRLKVGSRGQVRIRVRGKGPILSLHPNGLPPLPFNLPIEVQLQHRGGACWGSRFEAAGLLIDSPIRFRGRGD